MTDNVLADRKIEFFEKEFRINIFTTFKHLKEYAWDFWDESAYDSFRFYDEALNDILAESQVNEEEVDYLDNRVTVNEYFK